MVFESKELKLKIKRFSKTYIISRIISHIKCQGLEKFVEYFTNDPFLSTTVSYEIGLAALSQKG